MADDDINAGAINDKIRGSASLDSNGERRAEKVTQKIGSRSDVVNKDHLGSLPGEVFSNVVDNIEFKDIESLSKTSKAYKNVLGKLSKDIKRENIRNKLRIVFMIA